MAKKHGILLKIFIFLLVLVLIVVGGVIVVVNLTPRQLGIAQVQVTPQSNVEQLGIADVRMSQILSLLSTVISEPNKQKIAPNAYTLQDAESADALAPLMGLSPSQQQPDYKKLMYGLSPGLGVKQPLTIAEKQLAYMVSAALQQFYVSVEGGIAAEIVDAVEVMKLLDATAEEITLYRQDGDCYMKTVVKLNVKDCVAEINKQIPVVQIADVIYCTIVNKVTVEDKTVLGITVNEGVLTQKEFVSVTVNDRHSEITEKVLDALFIVLTEEGKEPATVRVINDYVFMLVSLFCKNIGAIGTVVQGEPSYGIEGINFQTDEITFLP